MTITVMVVEDNKEEQKKAKEVFEKAGYRVIIACSYEEFQQKALQFNSFKDISSEGKKIYYGDPNFPENKKTGELVDCIVTDLTFPEHSSLDSEVGDFGFVVFIRATKLGIPCYICTNSEHHGLNGKRGLIEEMMRVTGVVRPYSYRKNWASFVPMENH